MSVAVYVRVRRSNRDAVALADLARRQANYLGPRGFIAMRNQTDEEFRSRGYHRLLFPSLPLAKAFQQRVEENCDGAVYTQRFLVRPKPPARRRV